MRLPRKSSNAPHNCATRLPGGPAVALERYNLSSEHNSIPPDTLLPRFLRNLADDPAHFGPRARWRGRAAHSCRLRQQPPLLGALASNLSIARSAHAAGSETLRVGLIGCGGRGDRSSGPSTSGRSACLADGAGGRLRRQAADELAEFAQHVPGQGRGHAGAVLHRLRRLSKRDQLRG